MSAETYYVKVYRTAEVFELELGEGDLLTAAAEVEDLPPEGEETGPRAILREALRLVRAGEVPGFPPDAEFVAMSWDEGNVLRTAVGVPGEERARLIPRELLPPERREPRIPVRITRRVSRRGSKPGGGA